MKLSLYTFVRNGLFYDFHVVQMLRHHLPLADEIIVNEGYSDDGTYEAISNIDPKIKVHRFHWDESDPSSWSRKFKNQARELCTGDWCILLDCDEFIPEWEFERLRQFLEQTDKTLVAVRFLHFYGNYKVRLVKRRAIVPELGWRIHRNIPDVEAWGDGANVRLRNQPYVDVPETEPAFDVHHLGNVRHAARLRQKWRIQAKRNNASNPTWDKVPSFVFDLMPHRWSDDDFLKDLGVYEGPYIRAVLDDPAEFTRDDFWLYHHLKGEQATR
jgi:glycosyltransferase involved in cell wall biosynthesis